MHNNKMNSSSSPSPSGGGDEIYIFLIMTIISTIGITLKVLLRNDCFPGVKTKKNTLLQNSVTFMTSVLVSCTFSAWKTQSIRLYLGKDSIVFYCALRMACICLLATVIIYNSGNKQPAPLNGNNSTSMVVIAITVMSGLLWGGEEILLALLVEDGNKMQLPNLSLFYSSFGLLMALLITNRVIITLNRNYFVGIVLVLCVFLSCIPGFFFSTENNNNNFIQITLLVCLDVVRLFICEYLFVRVKYTNTIQFIQRTSLLACLFSFLMFFLITLSPKQGEKAVVIKSNNLFELFGSVVLPDVLLVFVIIITRFEMLRESNSALFGYLLITFMFLVCIVWFFFLSFWSFFLIPAFFCNVYLLKPFFLVTVLSNVQEEDEDDLEKDEFLAE